MCSFCVFICNKIAMCSNRHTGNWYFLFPAWDGHPSPSGWKIDNCVPSSILSLIRNPYLETQIHLNPYFYRILHPYVRFQQFIRSSSPRVILTSWSTQPNGLQTLTMSCQMMTGRSLFLLPIDYP